MASNPTQITLEESLDIADACAFQGELKLALGKGNDIAIASDELTKIDTTILQLLVALVRETQAAGNKVVWHSPSQALLKTANLAGLEKELGVA